MSTAALFFPLLASGFTPAPRLSLTLSQPTQAENEANGVRDWPSTVISVRLEDECQAGAQRYVLEGCGTCDCDGSRFDVAPNTLVRVDADATLKWERSGDEELVLLTPEYQGPPLLPIAGGFLAVCVALIVAVSSGGGT